MKKDTKSTQTNYFSSTFGLEAINPKREAKKPQEKHTQQAAKPVQETINITTASSITDQEKCKYKILEAFPITFII